MFNNGLAIRDQSYLRILLEFRIYGIIYSTISVTYIIVTKAIILELPIFTSECFEVILYYNFPYDEQESEALLRQDGVVLVAHVVEMAENAVLSDMVEVVSSNPTLG